MNIFVTSSCPIECAKALDDKRVVKMVLESTQMLCTALNELDGERICVYKSAHVNHPCSKWVRESFANWDWLYAHAISLSTEYTKRYNKLHKSHAVLEKLRSIAFTVIHKFDKEGLTPFVNCTSFKDEDDTFNAYRMYLEYKWDSDKREPTWYGK